MIVCFYVLGLRPGWESDTTRRPDCILTFYHHTQTAAYTVHTHAHSHNHIHTLCSCTICIDLWPWKPVGCSHTAVAMVHDCVYRSVCVCPLYYLTLSTISFFFLKKNTKTFFLVRTSMSVFVLLPPSILYWTH